MFNYECTQRSGTVVGSCMDGFLYGTCCKLPPGVSLSTFNVPETTPSKPHLTSASDRSTSFLKPHVEHSPEETFLLYKNGTPVQNVNSPDDFLILTKKQAPSIPQTSPLPATNDDRLPSSSLPVPSDRIDIYNIPNNISPSQMFDMAMSSFTNKPTTREPDRISTADLSKPYTTTSSRESFSPNFSSSKYNAHTTKVSPFTNTMRTTDYFSQSSKFTYSSTSYIPTMIPTTVTNKNDIYDEEENLVRVPTITADGFHKYGSNTSINHILWLLNDTKTESEIEDISTQPTQSFYTWLSVQNNPDKGSSSLYSTKPIHNFYYDTKPSTPLPSTTLHHIPGPSFHVTPEVKITPKPQSSVSESVPTVIVLTSAQETASTPPKKPVHSTYSTTATYNVSYHYPQFSSSSTKPYNKPIYSSSTQEKPAFSGSILITAKPSQASYNLIRPQTAGYISKPSLGDAPASVSHVHTAFPIISTPLSVKPITTTTQITSTMQSYNKIKPVTDRPTTTSTTPPSFIQHTTMVTTAKPIWGGNVNSDSIVKPTYSPSPIPSYINSFPAPTSSPLTVRPPLTGMYDTVAQPVYDNNALYSVYQGSGVIINATENIFDFPPVRDPNVTFAATQQEKPLITSTTTFGDEEIDGEVTPPFVVDKTLEDKMHVFVEKIVQSLQGNFEDLEKVLINGESTNNVTVNTGPQKKPSTVTKRPTKKPTSTKPTNRPKPAITTLPVTSSVITKKPTKKPTLATPVVLFQPSSTSQTTINIPNKKPPIKVTTTISISPSSSTTNIFSTPEQEEELAGTTTKAGAPSESDNIDYKKGESSRHTT